MKRLFTLFALLTALLCNTTLRAENYGIRVAGVNVTDANKDNITGTGISGKVYYDSDLKRLVFENGTRIETELDGISNMKVEGLSIIFRGNVSIKTSCTNETAAGIICFKKTTLTKFAGETSSVTITNEGAGGAIHSNIGAKIVVWGIKIKAQAKKNDAVKGLDDKGTLEIHSSRIYASGGSGKAAYTGFTDGFSLSGSVIDNSECTINTTLGGIVKDGALVNSCWIEPSIMIGGLYLSPDLETELTAQSIGATSASGKIKWEKTANKLTLTNVDVKGSYFLVRVPNLKIELVGDCSFESPSNTNDTGISIYENTTIEGDVTLKLTSHMSSGIRTYYNANVTLKLKELQAIGKDFGVTTGGTMTLNKLNHNTVYKFAGETANVSAHNLVMNDIDIASENSYWNASDGLIYYNGSVAKSFAIYTWFKSTNAITYLPLWVADIHIRNNNTKYIYSPMLTDGNVSYDKTSKTLTINGATINSSSVSNVVYNESIDGLTINILGTNNFSIEDNFVQMGASTTVVGDGTVNCTTLAYNGYGFYLRSPNITLTLDGPTFNFTSQVAVGGTKQGDTLTVKSGKIVLEPDEFNSYNYSGLRWLNAVNFENGCAITEPIGCTYSTSLYALTVDGTSIYSGKMVIEKNLGDVNSDGNITPADAIMILYHYFNVTQNGFNAAAADVNHDGTISPADAIEVLYKYFGTSH